MGYGQSRWGVGRVGGVWVEGVGYGRSRWSVGREGGVLHSPS